MENNKKQKNKIALYVILFAVLFCLSFGFAMIAYGSSLIKNNQITPFEKQKICSEIQERHDDLEKRYERLYKDWEKYAPETIQGMRGHEPLKK